jgi:hypothetical protein
VARAPTLLILSFLFLPLGGQFKKTIGFEPMEWMVMVKINIQNST